MEIPELFEKACNGDYQGLNWGGEAFVFKGTHSNYGIIGILTDSSTPPKRIGYIMPYMQIGSLDEIVHNKNRSYDDIYTNKQINSWIIKICCGLSYLHSRDIIHRDTKPSNILLGESYNDVQLSDFGISRSISSLTRSLTTGRGTPVYMAPEIFESGKYNFSADIYSLSITIWEILHRRILSNHLSKTSDGERPQVNNNLSKEVSDLLTKCWDNDSSKRPIIHYVQEFCRKTIFTLIGLEDDVNECETSFRNLNVHNDESFSKTITANNVESGGAQNELTVVRTRASNNGESLPQIPLKKPNENFHTPNSVEESSEEQTILLVGGVDGKGRLATLLMLENNGQNWKQLNIKLSYAIEGHGAQFLNNNIYIFGGDYSNWTYKLSKSLKWEKMADMNQKRSDISNSSVILNNQIWVCGGSDKPGNSLKSVEMYDPEKKMEIHEVGSIVNVLIIIYRQMNQYRSQAAAAVSVMILPDVWTLIRNMPQKIWGHGAVEIDGYFIVMGGWNSKEGLKNVWALDTMDKNAKWIEKPPMSIPRKDFSIGKINEKIFICGGWCDSVEIFDGEVWRDGPKMPTSRSGALAVVIPMSFGRSLN